MSLLVAVSGRNNRKLIAKLSNLLPDANIVETVTSEEPRGDNDSVYNTVEFVLAWNPSPDIWHKIPHLKAISSYGAGVDSLLTQSNLPNVPIARIVDPNLAVSMSEYVQHAIGYFKLRFNQYLNNKQTQTYKPRRAKSQKRVGVLGLGQLGVAVAQHLSNLGYQVSGWSRNPKDINNIACFNGKEQLGAMVSDVDYLVCLLPLTDDTRGILNKSLFDAMPQGSVLINVARGNHLNEQDLLEALASEQLSGAALDVFSQEPLPAEHPFWQQPNILLTPHVSAVTSVDTACEQIAANYRAMQQGQPLNNVVDVKLGY